MCVIQGVRSKQRPCEMRWTRNQLRASPEPPGLPGTVHGDPGATGSGTVAPHAAHFLFNARRLHCQRSPSLRPRQARLRAVPSRSPGAAALRSVGGGRPVLLAPRGLGRALLRAGPHGRHQNFCPQPRNSPIAKSFRLCTSSSPSALPLAQGGGGPGPRLRAALFRGPGSCIYMHISLATLSTEAQAPETCLPNHCF